MSNFIVKGYSKPWCYGNHHNRNKLRKVQLLVSSHLIPNNGFQPPYDQFVAQYRKYGKINYLILDK